MTNANGTAGPPKLAIVAADVPALDLTPTFSNRCNITINQNVTRFAFGEFVVGDQVRDVTYHTAIVMPTADAIAVAETLNRLIMQLHEVANTTQSNPSPLQQPNSENAIDV